MSTLFLCFLTHVLHNIFHLDLSIIHKIVGTFPFIVAFLFFLCYGIWEMTANVLLLPTMVCPAVHQLFLNIKWGYPI